MSDLRCAAAVPALIAGAGFRWLACGEVATAVYRYACVHEHVVERATCPDHKPEPGAVGCRACFNAGHECPMIASIPS